MDIQLSRATYTENDLAQIQGENPLKRAPLGAAMLALKIEKRPSARVVQKKLPVKENGRLAPERVAQAEKPCGPISRAGSLARLGAHWEGGLFNAPLDMPPTRR
jgi:hypothetical protein